ncbi:Retrovirus-related Pol polyprotein from transposon, partial [Trichinella britovi]
MFRLVWALREFRPYLYGQRFLVRTDHSCLRWLLYFKKPEGQVARWVESLAVLDFEVEHRPGRLHVTDQLRSVRKSDKELDQLLAPQQANPEIQLLRQWLSSGPWPTQCPHEWPIWIVQEDLICRHRDGLTAEERATQVLVLRALSSEIMRSLHNSRYVGHLCEQRTLSRSRSRFYCPGMSGGVHLWCRTCTQCAVRKRPSKNSRALMQPMTAGYPLQRVGMDILGPLENTSSGN